MIELMPSHSDLSKDSETGAAISRLLPGCNPNLLVNSTIISVNGTLTKALPYAAVITLLRDRTTSRNVTFLPPAPSLFSPSAVKKIRRPSATKSSEQVAPKPLVEKLVKYITSLNERHETAPEADPAPAPAAAAALSELDVSISKTFVTNEILSLRHSVLLSPTSASPPRALSLSPPPSIDPPEPNAELAPGLAPGLSAAEIVSNAKLFLFCKAYEKVMSERSRAPPAPLAPPAPPAAEAAAAALRLAHARRLAASQAEKEQLISSFDERQARARAAFESKQAELTTLLTDSGAFIQTLQQANEDHTSRIAELEVNLHTHQSASKSKASALSTLNASHSQLNTTLKELMSQTCTLESQKTELVSLLASKDSHIATLTRSSEALTSEVSALQATALESSGMYTAIEQELSRVIYLNTEQSEQLAATSNELAATSDDLAATSDELAEKDSHLSDAMDQIIVLTSAEADLKNLMTGFKENAEEYKRMYENEQSTNELLQQNVSASGPANEQLASFNQQLNDENKQLSAQVTALQATLRDHEDDKEGMKRVVLSTSEQNASLRSSLDATQLSLDAALAEVSSTNTAFIKLQAQTEVESELQVHDTNKTNNQIQLWKSRFSEKETELQDAMESYESQFDGVASMVENLRAQVDQTKTQRAEEVSAWSDKCSMLETLVSQAEDEKNATLLKKKSEYEKLLDQVEQLTEHHTETLAVRDQRVLALENAVEKSAITERHMESEIDELTEDKQSQIADLVAQVNAFEMQMKQQADTRDMEAVALDVNRRIKVEQLTKELEECKSREFMSSEEVSVLKRELEQTEEDFSQQLEQASSSWRLKLQEAETRAFEAIDMCDESDKEVASRNKMVEEKDASIWKLKEELVSKERECAALVAHIEILDKKIGSMKTMLSTHSKKMEDLQVTLKEEGAAQEQLEDTQTRLSESKLIIEDTQTRLSASKLIIEDTQTRLSASKDMLESMQTRNETLEKELKQMRESVPPASPSPRKARSPAQRTASPLSPTFNGTLSKKYDECEEMLTMLKKSLVEELTPSKKRKPSSPTAENKRKDMVLKRVQNQVDNLLGELITVKETLEEREDVISQLSEAVTALEEDRKQCLNELDAQDKFVAQAETMVERELQWRQQAELQFQEVRKEIDGLEIENGKLRDGASRIDDDWREKVSSMKVVTKSVGLILGGGWLSARITRQLTRSFYLWRSKVASDSPGSSGALSTERQINADLMALSSTNAANHEQRIMWLEEENDQLKSELGVVGHNSQMLLDAGREMREERMIGEALSILRGVLGGFRSRGLGSAFRKWSRAVERERGFVEGKGVNEGVMGVMEQQLQSTKVKLQVLKGALREGGYISKTPVKGGEQEEGGDGDSTFFWELSSEEGEEN